MKTKLFLSVCAVIVCLYLNSCNRQQFEDVYECVQLEDCEYVPDGTIDRSLIETDSTAAVAKLPVRE